MEQETTIVQEMKELLSDPKNRIRLDDFITKHLKTFLIATSLQNFPVQNSNVQKETFLDRLRQYERAVHDLQQITILLARWGEEEQLSLLEKILTRIAEADKGSSGISFWIHFGWYPTQIIIYSAGLAALSAKKYAVLKIILTTLVKNQSLGEKHLPIIVVVSSNLSDVHDAFKWIPGQEQKYVPRSEHFFQILEPMIQDLLFVGESYEELFDDFEVYSALVYIDVTERNWGPLGRFGWKYGRGNEGSYSRIIEEAERLKAEWPPLKAGMFDGSLERFLRASTLLKQLLDRLSWF